MGKTVLLIGSGGREHALAWKLAASPQVSRLIVVPGNEGMHAERWAMPLSTRGDFESIARKALEQKVDLVVVGPDNPLAEGIVDVFESFGILSFGPRAAAAKIEASKAFAKEIMLRAQVPTARYFLAQSFQEARVWLEGADWATGWVLKADGLALGKGVQVCETLAEALTFLEFLKSLGGESQRVVIEERLRGEEISWFAFCDGERCALLDPARDHKRAFDRDQGPNTGGMGAYSPVPGVPDSFAERVRNEVFLPTLREMKRVGTPFQGLLYAGLMADFAQERFWVLEFNCRFGDPETQVVLSRMKDDLFSWCEAVAKGDIRSLPAQVGFTSDFATVVVAASKGYPEKPETGFAIEGILSEPEFFCAGVKKSPDGKWVTSGGRVLGAMGLGETMENARAQAYERIRSVKFSGMHYRSDIGSLEGTAR